MIAEEKQALIEHAKSWIANAEAARDEIPFGFDEDAEKELALIKIALAALTAQPVKQPGTECIGWVKEAIQEHDAKWRDAVRSAGYEVQE